jgi:hypothetical protein
VKRKPDEVEKTLCCSFCRKSQKEVRKLIAGPTVYICDECIGLCSDIVAEEIEQLEARREKAEPREVLTPQPPDRDRLLGISDGLRKVADAMRRDWIIEDQQSVSVIRGMADRIAALAEEIREELAR